MTASSPEIRTVVVEREIACVPDTLWRALTQPHLLAEWLMESDFKPLANHPFTFRADWGVVDCKVITIEPNKVLSYRWDALGLESIVTWTLTPTSGGTRVRMEQVGFKPEQEQAYQGAKFGWPKFLNKLEELVARAYAVSGKAQQP